jgi:hypothetical protein
MMNGEKCFSFWNGLAYLQRGAFLAGPNVIKLFCPQLTNFCNKVECLLDETWKAYGRKKFCNIDPRSQGYKYIFE